jgi:hypothetical protein
MSNGRGFAGNVDADDDDLVAMPLSVSFLRR